ncbi:hypothetical protein B0H19DRAFT_1271084 [Mycena capillaripes]|nr:hypothetical protein B0H19DRAFT_1271084 [Mycena capillaripes]
MDDPRIRVSSSREPSVARPAVRTLSGAAFAATILCLSGSIALSTLIPVPVPSLGSSSSPLPCIYLHPLQHRAHSLRHFRWIARLSPPPISYAPHARHALGAAVVGFRVSCVVFGILLTQVWTYFSRYNSNTTLDKILVVVILLLEATDRSFIGHFVYFYTMAHADNPFAHATGTTTWSIIILLALGQLGVAMVFHSTSIPALLHSRGFQPQRSPSASGSSRTCAHLFLVAHEDRAEEFRSANSLISRLVSDAINTGVLTTAVSLSNLLLFDFLEGNLIFGATCFILSKLYAVSFLATLNTRRVVRGRGANDEESISPSLSDAPFGAQRNERKREGRGGGDEYVSRDEDALDA